MAIDSGSRRPRILKPHPSTRGAGAQEPGPSELSLAVSLEPRADGGLDLQYLLEGDLDSLYLPPFLGLRRGDRLWERTCFEAFLGTDSGAYREFNFSPCGAWAAYAFRGYREREPWEGDGEPCLDAQRQEGRCALRALLLPAWIPSVSVLRIGLSAVLEAQDGTRSYWALEHAPGVPDFHHPSAFALEWRKAEGMVEGMIGKRSRP